MKTPINYNKITTTKWNVWIVKIHRLHNSHVFECVMGRKWHHINKQYSASVRWRERINNSHIRVHFHNMHIASTDQNRRINLYVNGWENMRQNKWLVYTLLGACVTEECEPAHQTLLLLLVQPFSGRSGRLCAFSLRTRINFIAVRCLQCD